MAQTAAQRLPARKKLVFDTIKGRLLILLTLVAWIPIAALGVFTLDLLEFHLSETENLIFNTNQQIIINRLTAFQKQQTNTLTQWTRTFPPQQWPSICETNQNCFWIDTNKRTLISTQPHPTNTTPWLATLNNFRQGFSHHSENISTAYLVVNKTLYWVAAIAETHSTNRWFMVAYPLTDFYWKGLYQSNHNLEVGTWVLNESTLVSDNRLMPNTDSLFLARGANTFSRFDQQTEKRLLSGIQSLQHQTVGISHLTNMAFKLGQTILVDFNNEPVARLIVILPTTKTSTILNQYKSGFAYIGFACLIFSLVAGIFTARLFTQPLLQLVDEVKAINETKDLTRRVTALGVDEINQLHYEFNEMLDRLQEEEQQKDTFVATLTHDLKVPLLSEKQSLTYLLDGTFGPLTAEQQELMTVLQSTNQSNLDLVNSILEIYRYEAGKIQLNPTPINLIDIVTNACQELQPLALHKTIELQPPSANAEPHFAIGDLFAIKRVCHNLLSNAVTHTHQHGQIHCAVVSGNDLQHRLIRKLSRMEHTSLTRLIDVSNHMIVTIEDNGLGFPKEYLEQLFSQFQSNKNRNPLSTGLGLYHCYQIIQAHHGHIWVETTEGEGSLVAFSLPVMP